MQTCTIGSIDGTITITIVGVGLNFVMPTWIGMVTTPEKIEWKKESFIASMMKWPGCMVVVCIRKTCVVSTAGTNDLVALTASISPRQKFPFYLLGGI